MLYLAPREKRGFSDLVKFIVAAQGYTIFLAYAMLHSAGCQELLSLMVYRLLVSAGGGCDGPICRAIESSQFSGQQLTPGVFRFFLLQSF